MGRHPTGGRRRLARFVAAAGLAAATLATSVPGNSGGDQERYVWWSAVRNGAFEERGAGGSPPEVPWWRTTRGAAQIEVAVGGGSRLRTGPGERADQPFAAYVPLLDLLTIRGKVRGAGVVSITDGGGTTARFPLRSGTDETSEFVITTEDLTHALGRAPVPRFVLTLTGDGDATAF